MRFILRLCLSSCHVIAWIVFRLWEIHWIQIMQDVFLRTWWMWCPLRHHSLHFSYSCFLLWWFIGWKFLCLRIDSVVCLWCLHYILRLNTVSIASTNPLMVELCQHLSLTHMPRDRSLIINRIRASHITSSSLLTVLT